MSIFRPGLPTGTRPRSRPRARLIAKLLLAIVVLLLGGLAWVIVSGGKDSTMKGQGQTGTVISRDGTRIAFTKMGTGPAVILVDGAFCFRENGPAPDLAPALAGQFTVYAYDRRGRGESTDTPPYAVDREIEDLDALVREAGGSAFAIGVSSGGALALQAVARGVALTRLALYEPPYPPPAMQTLTPAQVRAHVEPLLRANDRQGAVKYFMSDVYRAPRLFVAIMPFVMRRAWNHNVSVAHTLPYDQLILEDESVLTDRRASITVPTLVIGGEKSPELLRAAVSRVAAALPNARSQFLANQDHSLRAPVVAPIVRDFFLGQ